MRYLIILVFALSILGCKEEIKPAPEKKTEVAEDTREAVPYALILWELDDKNKRNIPVERLEKGGEGSVYLLEYLGKVQDSKTGIVL